MALAFVVALQWFIYFLLLLAGFSAPRYCSWVAPGHPPMKVNVLTRFISSLLLKCVFVESMIFWEHRFLEREHTTTHTLSHTHTHTGACTLHVHLSLMDGPAICGASVMHHLFRIIACGFIGLPLLLLGGSRTPSQESQFSDPCAESSSVEMYVC